MNILYLRTRYDLNLRAGGSVGHTAGVVNALGKYVRLGVWSNALLPGVREKIEMTPVLHCAFLPADIKEIIGNVRIIWSWQDKLCSYQAIYQRYSAYSFAGAYFARKHGLPFILEFNSSEVWKLKHWENHDRPLFFRILRRIYTVFFRLPVVSFFESYNLRTAKMIVVVSKILKENLIQQGVSADKILVNPNGVDETVYCPRPEDLAIREQYGLREKTVVGFIGTFGQWHGVLEMARAICLFFLRYENLRDKVYFLLVGDGVLKREAERIIQGSPQARQVIFTGLIPQEEAVRYLNACDIFLSPHILNSDGSRFFGSPTKLFEYMAMGKGIVASALDQLAEILEDGKTAYLVPPGDVAALAEGIAALAGDAALRRLLGDNARKKAVECHTWDIHVKRILQKLEEMYG